MSSTVLDASALLCLLNAEPGAQRVFAVLPDAMIGAVNLCEVYSKLIERGVAAQAIDQALQGFALKIEPFDQHQAKIAAGVRGVTRQYGLSLGDRACLALALSRSAKAMTADRAWAQLPPACGTVDIVR